MPTYIVTLLIGLIAGGAIGYLARAMKSGSALADRALLDDYKLQLDGERSKTESAIKLATEINAVKESVQKLSTQSHEANRIRTEAEAKLETTINEMRRASESIFDETKKIAGALCDCVESFCTDSFTALISVCNFIADSVLLRSASSWTL